MRRRRYLSTALLMLGQSAQSVTTGGFALFLPLIRSDLGITFAQAGAIAALATLMYACMQIPPGYLVDRVDPKRLFIMGLAGTNALTFLLALLHEYRIVLATQALNGALSCAHVCLGPDPDCRSVPC